MNTKFIATVLIAASATVSVSAFAAGGSGGGGTGPAGPVGYDWGATAQGQRVQKAWDERHAADHTNASAAYGGADSTKSQSGAPATVDQAH